MAKRKDPSDNTDETPNQKQPRKPRARRIKGTGSVYPRADGRWGADFIVEATGKKKTVYGKTAKEAQEKLDKALMEQKQGILATGPQQKVSDYLNWWMEEAHKLKVRESSYRRYKVALDKHILPELGHIQLRKLTARQVQEFYNKELKEGQSPSSVHTMHKVLHAGLKRAVQLRYIPYNPSDGVSLPDDEPQREGQSLTLEQAKHLVTVAHGHRLEAFIALALTTGMRHGELTALRWGDIDFEAGIISICRTVSGEGSYRIEGPPKTKKSKRDVLLTPGMQSILKEHKKQQGEAKNKAGNAWQDNDLVFCMPQGQFLASKNTRLAFYRLLDKAGLPRIHIHDLRHTASTLWESLGIREKVRQELLGHTTLEMTRNKYTHIIPSMQKEASERIDTLLQ